MFMKKCPLIIECPLLRVSLEDRFNCINVRSYYVVWEETLLAGLMTNASSPSVIVTMYIIVTAPDTQTHIIVINVTFPTQLLILIYRGNGRHYMC